MLLTNIYAVTNVLLLQIHGIIDQNVMPIVCMESLLPFLCEVMKTW